MKIANMLMQKIRFSIRCSGIKTCSEEMFSQNLSSILSIEIVGFSTFQ